MTLAAEKKLEHIGETSGCADHDHDLIHDLSKRLASPRFWQALEHSAIFSIASVTLIPLAIGTAILWLILLMS